jgi:hypothetical protein
VPRPSRTLLEVLLSENRHYSDMGVTVILVSARYVLACVDEIGFREYDLKPTLPLQILHR